MGLQSVTRRSDSSLGCQGNSGLHESVTHRRRQPDGRTKSNRTYGALFRCGCEPTHLKWSACSEEGALRKMLNSSYRLPRPNTHIQLVPCAGRIPRAAPSVPSVPSASALIPPLAHDLVTNQPSRRVGGRGRAGCGQIRKVRR